MTITVYQVPSTGINSVHLMTRYLEFVHQRNISVSWLGNIFTYISRGLITVQI